MLNTAMLLCSVQCEWNIVCHHSYIMVMWSANTSDLVLQAVSGDIVLCVLQGQLINLSGQEVPAIDPGSKQRVNT